MEEVKNKKDFRDILKIEGVKAKGYGVLPKMLMLDRELSIEAKAIYSYFCSYAGAGTTAFPSVKKIIDDLCISRSRYYKHFNLLKDLGYIEVEQIKSDSKFSHNIYTLVEKPRKKPSTQNKYTEEKEAEKPCTCFEHTENETPQNKTTNINKSLINSNNVLYNQSIYQDKIDGIKEKPKIVDLQNVGGTNHTGFKKGVSNNTNLNNTESNNIYNQSINPEITLTVEDENIDKIEQEKNIKTIIAKNIEYPILKKQYREYEEIYNLIVDIVSSNKKYITISGENIPIKKVKDRFMSLNQFHIEYVIKSLKENKNPINNIRSYLLACLYNAPTTMNSYYTNKVSVDGW